MRRLRSLSPAVVAFSAWLLASCGSDPTSLNGFTDPDGSHDGSGMGSGGMLGGGNGGSRPNAGGSNATSNGGTPVSETGGAGPLGNGGASGDAGPLGNGGALGGNGGSPVRDASLDGPTPDAGPADASTDADAGCDQRFCAGYRSGIGCCLPAGRCGVDFGMGCVPIVPGQDGG